MYLDDAIDDPDDIGLPANVLEDYDIDKGAQESQWYAKLQFEMSRVWHESYMKAVRLRMSRTAFTRYYMLHGR